MKIGYEVRSIMTRDIKTIPAAETIGEAVKQMLVHEIGSLVVIRDDEMAGILTERDVIRQLAINPECTLKQVGDVMSRPLITVDVSASLGKAAETLGRKKIRRLLVTEKGVICGILTERDLMRATLDVFIKLKDAWL